VARLVGINHVALEVGDDVDAAVAFWRAIFPDLELRGRIPGMAFVDMGDQFVALAEGRSEPPHGGRHFGLVVDDRHEVLRRAREAGATLSDANDFFDPWGNLIQVVEYRNIQFTKAPEVLRAMRLDGEKTKTALSELREKGIEPSP